jgi:hypothetical protein
MLCYIPEEERPHSNHGVHLNSHLRTSNYGALLYEVFQNTIKSMVLVKAPGIENTQIKHQATYMHCRKERGTEYLVYHTAEYCQIVLLALY